MRIPCRLLCTLLAALALSTLSTATAQPGPEDRRDVFREGLVEVVSAESITVEGLVARFLPENFEFEPEYRSPDGEVEKSHFQVGMLVRLAGRFENIGQGGTFAYVGYLEEVEHHNPGEDGGDPDCRPTDNEGSANVFCEFLNGRIDRTSSDNNQNTITIFNQQFTVPNDAEIKGEQHQDIAFADIPENAIAEAKVRIVEPAGEGSTTRSILKLKVRTAGDTEQGLTTPVNFVGRVQSVTSEGVLLEPGRFGFKIGEKTLVLGEGGLPTAASNIIVGSVVQMTFNPDDHSQGEGEGPPQDIEGPSEGEGPPESEFFPALKVQLQSSDIQDLSVSFGGPITSISGDGNSLRVGGSPIIDIRTASLLGHNNENIEASALRTGLPVQVTAAIQFLEQSEEEDGGGGEPEEDIRLTASVISLGGGREHADFDGDGQSNPGVFRDTSGTWFIRDESGDASGSNGFIALQWGLQGDIPFFADFDADGSPDLIVYRPTVGQWFILTSSSGYQTSSVVQWGLPGDIPLVCYFSDNGLPSLTIFRPSVGTWYALLPNANRQQALQLNGEHVLVRQWGLPTTKPHCASLDDGDDLDEMVVIDEASGNRFVLSSSQGWNREAALQGNLQAGFVQQFGLPGDTHLLDTDVDGDGHIDHGVARALENGQLLFIFEFSSAPGSAAAVPFGLTNDVPKSVILNDSQNRDGLGIFRPDLGLHCTRTPAGEVSCTPWGLPGDKPVS